MISREQQAAVCLITFTCVTGCIGYLSLEQFQTGVCIHSETYVDIWDTSYTACIDECRARATCSAITTHVQTHQCRLYGGMYDKIPCFLAGLLSSEKHTWRKKNIPTCDCNDGETCSIFHGACDITECHVAETISRGKILGNQRYVGAKIVYKCYHGYYMAGTGSSTCLASGMWSLAGDTLPTCVKDCSEVAPMGTNTNDPTVTGTTPGSTVQYQCIDRYQVTSQYELTLTCTVDGEWGNPPVCWKHCSEVAPMGTNTNDPTVTGTTPGSTVQYQCIPEYQVTSQNELTLICTLDGEWGNPPVCWKHCPETAPVGTNTYISFVSSTNPGSTAHYQCFEGFVMTSTADMTLTCSIDGKWGTPPTCVAVYSDD